METELTAKEQGEENKKRGWALKPYHWPKGVSGNPNGRPAGIISPKQKIRALFHKNPYIFNYFLSQYIEDPNNRRHVVEMLDGKPSQSMDMTLRVPQNLIDLFNGASNKTADNRASGEDTE